MDRNTALGEFLRSRRARITPRRAGLADDGGARRVPGLRREEIARLAGVSVDYYVRLERGRRANVSETVLNALSRALRLDPVEHAHLLRLAKPADPRPGRTATRPQPVRPGLRELLRTLDHTPALVLGRRLDVLASNRMARALLTDFEALPHGGRNLVRYMFCDGTARSRYVHWDTHARDLVASLRRDAGRHPDDPLRAELVAELSAADGDFRRWWADLDVHRHTHGTKHFRHPAAGPLTLHYESLTLPADPDQRLSIYTAAEGSPSEQALARLLD